jgi:hypothetical protein
MPDHVHVIAHQGFGAIRVGACKAMKAVVAGLTSRSPTAAADQDSPAARYFRPPRAWRWQTGFHDHKLRTPEAEQRKWEYMCFNPVRAGLVDRPEKWPFAGEILYDPAGAPRFLRGAPPLLAHGILIEEPDGGGGG